MNKRILSNIIILLILALILNFSINIKVNASMNDNINILSESEIEGLTENGKFSSERILVVLHSNVDELNKVYSIDDFPEIELDSIKELTHLSRNALIEQLSSNDVINNHMTINVDTYKRILSLKLKNPTKENVLRGINELMKRDEILSAEVDSMLYNCEVASVNDAYYVSDSQWSLKDGSGINIEKAWGFTKGSNEVVVGVIDTGIDSTHSDLVNRVDIEMSRDFSLDYPYILGNITDNHGHGTRVAGVIGAEGNNSIGICGINQNIKLVSLRINPSNGDTFASQLILAIDYAIEEDIPILNNSNGMDYFDGEASSIDALETEINNYSGLFVTSAGNINKNNDNNELRFPSNINALNLISVGSHNSLNEKEFSSNYGALTVNIYAPGEEIITTSPTDMCINCTHDTVNTIHISDGYHISSGTSMATPHVTGVAALLLSLNKDLTTQQLKEAILNSAETITITLPDDSTQNVKKLNAFNAVQYVLENYVITAYTVSNSIFETEINKTVVSGASYFNELNGLYKLTLTESKNYEFKLSSNSDIELILYDEDFNEIEYADLDSSSNKIHVIKLLASGKYYLRTKYVNEASSGTISINIVSSRNYSVTLGNNDILLNTYNYDNDITQSNVYSMHIDENKFGFYKFELVGYTFSGNEIGCPSASIVVKDSEQNIIDRIEYDGYLSLASNEEYENSFVVSLNQEGYIYIYIEIDTSGLNSLYLNIYPAEFEAIDLFGMYDNLDEQINVIENESTYGDYFKKITLNQSARFFVELANFSNLDDKVLFVLSKLNYNSSTDSYSLENIVMELMPYDEREFTYVLDLSKGTYFVGYFNKDDSSLFNLRFTRVVSDFSTTKLVSDPDSLSLYGSEVRYNDGDLRGNTITVGFTRILYLDYNLDVPSYSITSFDLFVSDSSVATVSVYGTMLARRSGTVDVIAIYKSNPSIIYSKTFTIVEETRTDDLVINISDEIENFDGEYLYQVSLNDLNCPYPQNTLYGWSVVQSNYNLTISLYGSVRLIGEDEIIIEGRYSLNPKVVIRITLTVN